MEPTTLAIGVNHPGPLGNRGLKVRLYGFYGLTWIDLPFHTRMEALQYATEKGWKVSAY